MMQSKGLKPSAYVNKYIQLNNLDKEWIVSDDEQAMNFISDVIDELPHDETFSALQLEKFQVLLPQYCIFLDDYINKNKQKNFH